MPQLILACRWTNFIINKMSPGIVSFLSNRIFWFPQVDLFEEQAGAELCQAQMIWLGLNQFMTFILLLTFVYLTGLVLETIILGGLLGSTSQLGLNWDCG